MDKKLVDDIGINHSTLGKYHRDPEQGSVFKTNPYVSTMPRSGTRDTLLREPFVSKVRNLSVVTSKCLYAPDLNKIAATIRANQQANVTDPSTPSQQLFVDDDGNIVFGDQVDGASGRQLSKVTQETFYSGDRYAQELAIVKQRLPKGTTWASDGEVGGWLYRIVNDLGDTYDLFLWYEVASATYKVSLVEPRLGGTVGVHDCHLFPDGTLCLKEHGGSGYRNLADAYARSVIWTLGASCYRRGYGFQFNMDQVS